MKSRIYPHIITTVALCGTTQLFAASVSNQTGEWDSLTWNAAVPTITDYAFLNGDNSLTIESPTIAECLVLNHGNSFNLFPALTVVDGTLNVGSQCNIAYGSDASGYANADLIIEGGNFNVNVNPEAWGGLHIGNFDNLGTAGRARLYIKGGTSSLDTVTIQMAEGTSDRQFIVEGSTAEITAKTLQTGIPETGGVPSTTYNKGILRFNLDDVGIAAINVTGNAFIYNERIDLIVDGSGYTGGSGTFVLINADSDEDNPGVEKVHGTGFNSETLNFSSTGLSASVEVDANGDLVLVLAENLNDGAVSVAPDTFNDELNLSLKVQTATTLSQPFLSVDLSTATIAVDGADPTQLNITIPGITQDKLFLRIRGSD